MYEYIGMVALLSDFKFHLFCTNCVILLDIVILILPNGVNSFIQKSLSCIVESIAQIFKFRV